MEIIVALSLIVAVATAVWFADRAISRPKAASSRHSTAAFPTRHSSEFQWERATSVVERSLERAASVVAANGAAARQLEAAEYALHCLLEDIGSVMRTNVQSPLLVHVAPVEWRQGRVSTTAMAA